MQPASRSLPTRDVMYSDYCLPVELGSTYRNSNQNLHGSNSVNHEQVQVLGYINYSLLPTGCWDWTWHLILFHLVALFNLTPVVPCVKFRVNLGDMQTWGFYQTISYYSLPLFMIF